MSEGVWVCVGRGVGVCGKGCRGVWGECSVCGKGCGCVWGSVVCV